MVAFLLSADELINIDLRIAQRRLRASVIGGRMHFKMPATVTLTCDEANSLVEMARCAAYPYNGDEKLKALCDETIEFVARHAYFANETERDQRDQLLERIKRHFYAIACHAAPPSPKASR